MSEKPLLLSSAKLRLGENTRSRWLYVFAMVGVLVVAFGAADLTSRASKALLGESSNFFAFAPLVELQHNPTFAATSTTPLVPALLTVPSIGVHAKVEAVGTKQDGSMGTPEHFENVGWYALGSKPGEAGSAVFGGHVNNALTTAGVFEHLSLVKVGDMVYVSDQSGRTLVFEVTEVQTYALGQAPASSIFAVSGPAQLVLITCDGDWVSSAKSFDKRLVVTARLQK